MPAARGSLAWRLGAIRIAFSESSDADARDPVARARFLARIGCRLPCVAPRQIHGKAIVDAAAMPDELAAADGLATAGGGPALAVFGADCPGLVLVSDDAFAVAHCGWRGTAAGIVPAAIAALAARTGAAASTWSAFIGPGICGEHYEVDAPVLTARRWPAEAVTRQSSQHAHLDLAAAIAGDLAEAGIARVHRCGVCTAEDARLWSYRRRGAGLVQALVAWRDPVAVNGGDVAPEAPG